MSTATFQNNTNGLRHYFADLSHAARAFTAALFAAQERQYVAQEVAVKPQLSARALQKSRDKLFAMANEWQAMSPNMAAELRNIASRD